MSKTTITYKDIAPNADRVAEFSGTGYEDFSQLTELRNENEQVNIATLEHNLWVLDGSMDTFDWQLIPFWSGLSDKNGDLIPQPSIIIEFPTQFSTTALTLIFDELSGSRCSYLNIKWYRGGEVKNGEIAGGEIVAEGDFQPKSYLSLCSKRAELFDKIWVTFRKTPLPFRRVRLRQVIIGAIRRYGMDEIRSARITNQTSLISTELPISTLDWTLDSRDDIGYMFQFKQPVEVVNDDFLIGVYYITESRRNSRSVYDLRCQDAIGVLDDDTFAGGVYANYSAKQLVLDIINGDFEVDFGTVDDVNLTGALPAMSKRGALQQVFFGWGVCAATDGGEVIRIFNLPDSGEYIGLDRAYTGVSVETSASITAVMVTAHKYVEDANGSIEINGKKYRDDQTAFAINNPDVTENTKANVLKIEGANFVNASNVEAVARRVYDYYMRRNTANVKIVWHGELVGDCVTVPDSWDDTHSGNIERMDITLSNTVAANLEVISDG